MLCPDEQCVECERAMREAVLERRPVRGINVSVNYHVSHEVIEQTIDLALEQRGNGLVLIVACAGLPDRVGVKIAQLIAVSETIEECCVAGNNFSLRTVLAISQALKSNKSLRTLALWGIRCCMYAPVVRDAFMRALYINPDRPFGSRWTFSEFVSGNTFDAYKKGKYEPDWHPTLQELLLGHLHRPIRTARWH